MDEEIKFDIDVDGDTPIGEVLAILEKHNISIEDYEHEGPGGGNPCLSLIAPTQEALDAFQKEWNQSEASVASISEE